MNDLDLLDDKILIWIYYKIPCFEKVIFHIFNLTFLFFILIFFCINKLKLFKNWLSENKYIPWTILLFTCIFLSWIIYPSVLNKVIVQKDNLVEMRLQKEEGSSGENQIVNADTLVENTNENFSYKKLGEGYGTLGDTYGALNTLFTGLAFGGLIVSIFLQMLELRATRKELAEQKDALIGQHKESSSQTEILNQQIKLVGEQKVIAENQSTIINNQLIESRKQNFTTLFNALLEERRFRIECFKIYAIAETSTDLDGFEVITSYAINLVNRVSAVNRRTPFLQVLKKFKHDATELDLVDPRKVFSSHWGAFESDENRNYVIGNYFSIIFMMFHLIEEYRDELDSSYMFYINMVKRLMNQHELLILFWISLGNPQNDEMIYRYELFERLSYTEGLGTLGSNVFRVEAFGNNPNWQACFE